MTVTLELCVFTTSDEYLANSSLANDGMNYMAKAEGHVNSYQGIQIQDSKTGYFVIVWETHEHHKKIMAQESYREVLQSIKPLYTGEFQMVHIPFEKSVTEALSAPVTEVVILTLKPGKSKDDLTTRVDDFLKVLENAEGAHAPGLFGWTIEKEDRAVAIFGWDSIEAHHAGVKGEEIEKLQVAIAEVADFEVKDVKLTKHC